MSSNLLKSYYVNNAEQNARVIDTNQIIEQKLERIRFVLPNAQVSEASLGPDEFEGGLDADELDPEALDALMAEGGAEDETDGSVSNIIKAEAPVAEPSYNGPSPEDLIADAQKEIEEMKAQAMAESEKIKQDAYEKAKELGYQDGFAAAQKETEKIKEALNDEKMLIEQQYEEKLEALEPKFVKVLTQIYEKIFEVELSDSKNLILSLLRNSMRKIEGCKNFLIHVSREDFPYVNEHKEELLSQSSQEGTTIDVIEDATLRKNDCMIETINGIFDCGLGTQLGELKKRLSLLSYEADDN